MSHAKYLEKKGEGMKALFNLSISTYLILLIPPLVIGMFLTLIQKNPVIDKCNMNNKMNSWKYSIDNDFMK